MLEPVGERERLRAQPVKPHFSPPFADQLRVRRARRAAQLGTSQLMGGYGSAKGYPSLRVDVARHLTESGVETDAKQILMIHGIVGAIDLCCRYLIKPGDTVFMDDPGYFQTFGHRQALERVWWAFRGRHRALT